MAGARGKPRDDHVYVRSELALRHGAGVETETRHSAEAYAPWPRGAGPPASFDGLPGMTEVWNAGERQLRLWGSEGAGRAGGPWRLTGHIPVKAPGQPPDPAVALPSRVYLVPRG